MRQPGRRQSFAGEFGCRHRARADQQRPPLGAHLGGAFDDRRPAPIAVAEDPLPEVAADDWPIRRDAQDIERIHRAHFRRHFGRRAAHAGQAQVAAEEALVGDARDGVAPLGKLEPLLDLDHLMQAALPRAIGHDPAGVFVDDLHLVVGNDVMPIALEEVQRRQPLFDEFLARPGNAPQPRQPAPKIADSGAPGVGQFDAALPGPQQVVRLAREAGSERQRLLVEGAPVGVVDIAGNDQGRSRLVDQHAVGFVDDGEVQPAQQGRRAGRVARPGEPTVDHRAGAGTAALLGDAVAQVVEDEVLVDAVGDVAGVRFDALWAFLVGDDEADAQPEEGIHRRQIGGIATRQVVVDGDHMHRRAGECHGHGRQDGRQGLAFTGLHFGQRPAQHRVAAHQLDRIMAQAELPRTHFTDQGETLGDRRVGESVDHQRLAHRHYPPPQCLLVDLGQGIGERLDVIGEAAQPASAPRRADLCPAAMQAADEAIEATVLDVAPFRVEAGRELEHPPVVEQGSRH